MDNEGEWEEKDRVREKGKSGEEKDRDRGKGKSEEKGVGNECRGVIEQLQSVGSIVIVTQRETNKRKEMR